MSTMLIGVVMEDAQVEASYLDVRLLAMIGSILVPLIVSALSKKTANDGVRAMLNIVGVGLVSVLAIWVNPSDQPVTVWLVINTFLASLLTSLVAYKGIWKPAGVTEAIAEKTANIGFGSAKDVEEDVVPEDDEPIDLDNDGIPDQLDDEGLDDLVAGVDVDAPVIEEDK